MGNGTREDLIRELGRVTEDYRMRSAQRDSVQRLGVTVWLAILVAVGSEKINISESASILLLVLTITSFWCMEMLHQTVLLRRQHFIRALEERLALGNYKIITDPLEIYYVSMEERVKLRDKLKLLIEVLRRREIMHALYFFELISSAVFVLVISKN